MSFETQAAQDSFMARGGCYELALLQMRKAGTLAAYVFHEYPKSLRISHGTETVTLTVETCKGNGHDRTWTEEREVFEDIIVNSEDEEERVLSGGKTSRQVEEDRQGLLMRCHSMGIPADPGWSAVRLRRELGDALDAPAPGDNMAKLEAELVNLRKMAAMREEIAMLRAQLDTPDEPIEELGTAAERRAAQKAAKEARA
jgi:hypothetical protein